ncbi:DUF2750 domain-containing protein [Staphylococcus pasteuri]|uniref:DUF2750 domain-containing protein n=3 Tax=Staphylococcus TaxID=1279 RepID=A0ABY1H4J7_9STAP|nr:MULTISPECIES: DUF2750 domain-containing protein [Staphylococcus]ODB78284.1 hypothetical protein A9N02_02600 [Staphylococcus sp. AOAB]RQX26423.1 DUF2750 domain-containing protein [Staphylococcus warneri]ATH62141.1 hypothetical protein BJG87_03590 [Staphylococcus pasteuri]KKI56471.1 hypothetical protein UF70_1439 [Staphylococcus pasteuri]MBL3399462.1 DUF2750 domain-containing protein [Staphylococcus pasteuri]
MSYKEEPFFKEMLINEHLYFASKNKKIVRLTKNEQLYVTVWTDDETAKQYLNDNDISYDKIVKIDLDRFVAYDLDELFDETDKVLIDITNEQSGKLVNIYEISRELMSELDKIRIKEFVKDVAKYDHVYGLTNKSEKNFILIEDDRENKPQIMPVWSLKKRAQKVKEEDFEECDLIEIETSVFDDWLDKLRDDDKAVGIDLKPGVIGTVVSAQKLSNEMTT